MQLKAILPLILVLTFQCGVTVFNAIAENSGATFELPVIRVEERTIPPGYDASEGKTMCVQNVFYSPTSSLTFRCSEKVPTSLKFLTIKSSNDSYLACWGSPQKCVQCPECSIKFLELQSLFTSK